jgi:inhibitor of KinA sporulation pathway (predicted exonuclease)
MVTVFPEQRRLLELPRLLVVDLELTCGPGITQDIQDIIEVGTFVLARDSGVDADSPVASFYVRPARSPITPFCTQLTGITREQVTNQPNFARVAPRLQELADASGAQVWVSWGQDQTLLHRQCVAAGVENPFKRLEHFDIKRLLTPLVYRVTGGTKPQGAGSGVGLETAMKALGLQFKGRAHSGAADALNTARLVQELRRQAEQHLKSAAGPRVQETRALARRARP